MMRWKIDQVIGRWLVVMILVAPRVVAADVQAPSKAVVVESSGEPDDRSDWPPPMETFMPFYWLGIDQLEWRGNDGVDEFRWDLQGWWGIDENKLWLKSEGEQTTSGASSADAEIQILYSRMVSAYWDVQVGARQDFLFGSDPDRERTFAVLAVEGLAPLWFEIEPSLFVSDAGDVSFRVTTTYDIYVTQRLVAQPRFELNAAVQDASKFGVQRGVNDVELGLRVRYEIRREFAPYIGLNWLRQLGNTANLARRKAEDVDLLGVVVGLRIQY